MLRQEGEEGKGPEDQRKEGTWKGEARHAALLRILAYTALVGSIRYIKPSSELPLLPSCHNTSTSYTWDYYELTCKVYVGVRMCVCVCVFACA